MIPAIQACRELLLILCRFQRRAWFQEELGDRPSTLALSAYHRMIGLWASLEEKDVLAQFPDSAAVEVDFSDLGRFLYLPPLEKDSRFVPVLTLQGCIDADCSNLRLRVLLVCCDDEKGDSLLHSIGFRFDSPKASDNTRRHTRYHAQLIGDLESSAYSRRRPREIEVLMWLPETYPAVVLPCSDSVALLLSLLLSLYDEKRCSNLVAKCNVKTLRDRFSELVQ